MLFRALALRHHLPRIRLFQMAAHLSNGASNSLSDGLPTQGVSLEDLPKSNIFTSSLPADSKFPTPEESFRASRNELGPRMVKGALYTFIRPEENKGPQILGVSKRAMKDIGLQDGEDKREEFRDMTAGNKILWNQDTKEGIYPWAQCYGGWQFGSWAGQLGDGRAISLFESTNPQTKVRYEIQLKGAGQTPYSRFADGKAVLRSSIREFVVSEFLNALNIPSTRALALTLTPDTRVRRESLEPGAIVTRFAQSWLRIGTFDILRARGDRDLIRTLATYIAENVFPGWESLPSAISTTNPQSTTNVPSGAPASEIQGPKGSEENRFTRLYRHICRMNALTVAKWQAYAFTNGVLNTDNTSVLGLSLDFGPFAFLDNFDPTYTPNHDDHMLRYSYRNQPSIIWWNLVRLGESLAELIGAGPKVDDPDFVSKGVSESWTPELIKRAETIIEATGEEYKAVFLTEYKRLMTLRLGLKTQKESDFKDQFSELLDTMEALELDFNHFFRRLSSVTVSETETEEGRREIAARFFHKEGVTGLGNTDDNARTRVASWLSLWRSRVLEDWGSEFSADADREKAMKAINPKFIPRSFILDELITRLTPTKTSQPDTAVLERAMNMALNPFEESWGGDPEEEERWCGDVPRGGRGMMCSCSS